jgi:hypothetical protein
MTVDTVLTRPRPISLGASRHLGVRAAGAVLALAVAYIHVKDQGGFPGDKTPHDVGIGYYLLEATGVVTALALLLSKGRATVGAWFLGLGVAVMPIVGFVLSRGPGLPGYTDDKGNWTEPLALWSIAVEAVLLLLAATAMVRERAALARR